MNKSVFTIILIMALSHVVYANKIHSRVLTVPFQFTALEAEDTLQVNYSFRDSDGVTRPIIFCLQGNSNSLSASLTWPYNGQQITANMPLALKTDPIYSGEFADFSGTLQIKNNNNVTIFVSCLYGF